MAEKEIKRLTENVEAGVLARDEIICDITEAAVVALKVVLAQHDQQFCSDVHPVGLPTMIHAWLDQNTEPAPVE